MSDPYGKTNLQPGFREFDGTALNKLFSRVFQGGLSRMDLITATAGGTKAAAYQLSKTLNRISICASGNDSVLLPAAIAGSMVTVFNSGAQTAAVYAKGADTIGTSATTVADTIATTKAKTYMCITKGAWFIVAAT